MPGPISRHVTYANVTASVALFIALGGISYAAVKLPANSVRSKTIADGQVKRPDVARGAIDSRRVRDGALTAEDFAPGTLLRGPAGERGAKGDPCPATEAACRGPQGEQGPGAIKFARNLTATTTGTPVPVAEMGSHRYDFACQIVGSGDVRWLDARLSVHGEAGTVTWSQTRADDAYKPTAGTAAVGSTDANFFTTISPGGTAPAFGTLFVHSSAGDQARQQVTWHIRAVWPGGGSGPPHCTIVGTVL